MVNKLQGSMLREKEILRKKSLSYLYFLNYPETN